MTELHKIAAELRQYALAHPLDVFKYETPHPEHYRKFVLEGHPWRVCFTYQVSGDIKGFILSIYDMRFPGTVPDEAECRPIADAFFPDGNYAEAGDLNVLQISRKYITFGYEQTTTKSPSTGQKRDH